MSPRLCGYCHSWQRQPCGDNCVLQPTDPTWEQLTASGPKGYPAWVWHLPGGETEQKRYIREDIADDLFAALEPFSRLEIPAKPEGNAGAYSIFHKWIKAAQSALEKAKTGAES